MHLLRAAIAVFVCMSCACGGPKARAPLPPSSIGINMAERYDDKLESTLRKRWYAGELQVREVRVFEIHGRIDERATELLITLGGRVLGQAFASDWMPGLVVKLPTEALPFLVPQFWLDRIELHEGAIPTPWSPDIIDVATLPEGVRAKLDPEVTRRLGDPSRNYSFSGTLTIAGCIDYARRAELITRGMDLGLATADARCEQSQLSFVAPVTVAPTIAALSWVLAIAAERTPEPTLGAVTRTASARPSRQSS
jgi:hypothetical protein